jgi:hypothetical protein
MAQNISDTVITNVIDQIAAVTKGQVAAYTTTESEDLFKIIVREQNPDDLSSGTTYAEAIDDSLAAGTAYYSTWGNMLTWLTTRATAAGSTNINGLISDRGLRVSHTFNDYVFYPTYGSNLTAINVFPDQYWNGTAWTNYRLGTYTQGGSTTLIQDTLPSSVSGFWGRVRVGSGGIGGPADFEFVLNVKYADNLSTASTETVVCPTGTAADTYIDIGAEVCSSTVTAAGNINKKVYTAGTASFTAGINQPVILWSGENHSLLTEDAFTGSLTLTVDINDIGGFNVNDLIYIDDDNSSAQENAIRDIDYENGVIYLKITTNADFTTAQNAIVYKRRVATLTADTLATSADVAVSLNDIWGFQAGDIITMHDTTPSTEKGEVLSVNYLTGVITLTAGVAADYTTGAAATITKDITDYGRSELAYVDTIQAGVSLTLTAAPKHTYAGANCKIIRLLSSIVDVDSETSGNAGDDVIFEPKVERNITQNEIIIAP